MAGDPLSLSLSPQEAKVLKGLARQAVGLRVPEEELSAQLSLTIETVRGSLERLKAKGLTVSSETHERILRLSPRGVEAREKGLPERRLVKVLSGGPLPQEEAQARCGLDGKEFAAAIGQLRREKALRIGEKLELEVPDPQGVRASEQVLGFLAGSEEVPPGLLPVAELMVKRGLLASEPVTHRAWSASENGRAIADLVGDRPSIGALTSEHLRTGSWLTAQFRPYDLRAQVPFITGPRRHEYLSWLREVEQLLLGLGFEERRGPIVETDFYNNDALFIPQSHPARTAQDVLFVEGATGKTPEESLLRRVKNIHEGRPPEEGEAPLSEGWGGEFNVEWSRRLLLRSQTTNLSVRYLLEHPTPPFRMYSIGPVFRRESLDAKHHIQFDQCEGVYGGEGVSLRNLLGLFTTMAREMGAGEVRFKPSYFPFTEPSVEGYVKHPRMGWMEVLPGGMFRPEVLRPLGIKVPVAAWGIGVMRLAMVSLGIDDIREIYGNRLDRLAESRV